MNLIPIEYDEDDIRAVCNESFVVGLFIRQWRKGQYRDRMPWSDPETDTLAREQAFKCGRADIVLYHADGSATVIEAKDGINGYQHVASAIGQASLYATQVAAKGAVNHCRRAVLWSALPTAEHTELIDKVIRDSGVTSLYIGDIRTTLSIRVKMRRMVNAWQINQTPIETRRAMLDYVLQPFEDQ